MSDVDPYELLRRARERCQITQDWVDDYNKLPGAKLSGTDLKILADPHRRLREGKATKKSVAKLLKDGYLVEVTHVGGRTGTYNSIRRTPKGNAALRLRGKV